MVAAICAGGCGKMLRASGSRSLPAGQRKCAECRSQDHGPSKSRAADCPVCGKPFTRKHRSRKRHPEGLTVYCSKSCARTALNRQRYGATTPEERKQREAQRGLVSARKRRMHLAAAGYDGVPDDEILARDGWLCRTPVCLYGSRRIYRSRKYPDPRSPSVDHIVPLSHGGSDTALNKRATHLGCNMARGNDLDEQSSIDFGAALDTRPPPRIRQYRDCELCGERVARTQACKQHTPLVFCRSCDRVIPPPHGARRTCLSCQQAQDEQRAERQRIKAQRKTCAAEGCERGGGFGAGYCAPHYLRLNKHGDVFAHIPIADNWLTRVEVGELIRAELNRT